MYKALLTKQGATRLGYPELAGEVVEYERIWDECVDDVYYRGERLGGILSFENPTDPSTVGCKLITRPNSLQ